jgi:lysophospholipase L1-like esterase
MIHTRLCTYLPLFLLIALDACSSDSPDQTQTGGVMMNGAGASAAGAPSSSGGTPAVAGATALGGANTAGASGSSDVGGGSTGGAGAAAGASAAGATAMAGAPPVTVGIPAGYPVPTADNAAKCKTVPMKGGFCPGGGAGPVCMQCLFGGDTYGNSETTPTAQGTTEAGHYLVTVKLSGTATSVSAESSRGLLAATNAGQSTDFAFVVDVRAMEGQPGHAGGPSGYPGLDLFFSGASATPPLVSAIGYGLAGATTKPVMVYMASDSTTCDQTGNTFGGWGQMLPQYFAPPVGIANWANSGASSGGFGFWKDITSRWTAGDWVIIQFGHNDKTQTDAQVQANLERYAGDALAANVTPIIVSPPARVQFQGSMEGSQAGLHAAAAKAAAAAKKVAYIDLTALSTAWYNSLGSQDAAMKFHVSGDPTHSNLAGADKIAALVAADIKAQKLGLAQYLRQ